MSRVPGGRRVIAGLLSSSLLFAVAIVPGTSLNRSVAAAEECPDAAYGEGSPDPTCYMSIDGAPASVPAGQEFSFDVSIRDAPDGGGSAVTGCWGSASIRVRIEEGEGYVSEHYQDADGGIAHFNLSVADTGSYTIAATAFSGCPSARIVDDYHDLEVVPAGTQCPPTQACSTPPITSEDGTVAVITAGAGSNITASFSTLAAAGFGGCPTFAPPDPNSVLTFNVTGSPHPKLIKFVENRAGPLRICWNAPSRFRQRGGGWSPRDSIAGQGFTGLLPNCISIRPTLPCVSPTLTRHGVSTIWILAPAGDPRMY